MLAAARAVVHHAPMKKLSFLPRAALVLAILLIIWFLIALFGAKTGLIDKMTAFGTMTAGIGAPAAMVTAVIALIALIVALVVKPRKGIIAALVALAIPLAVLAGFNQLRAQAGSVPFIYDVTTNTADAPTYSDRIVAERTEADANPIMDFGKPLGEYEKWAGNEDLASMTSAQLIAEGYPDLQTLVVEQSPADAITAIKDAMEMRGFENVTVDENAGTVEGTAIVFWYGFEDDVVARVRGTDTGASIDFRSTSRLGTSDLGVNAERVLDLRSAVADRLAKDFPKMEVETAEPAGDAGAEATASADE